MELEYKIFKLKNGETIISEVNSIDENKISLHRPMLYKIVTMVDPSMNASEVLMFRNWAEFSRDTDVEIPTDFVLSSWLPDVKMMNCYEMEKLKQDMPEIYKAMKKNDPELPKTEPETPEIPPLSGLEGLLGLPGMPNPFKPKVPPNMANFNLNLPMDVAKELINFLEQNGIELNGPSFDDDEDFIEDNEQNAHDESFGNHPDDWSPDPKDYLS